MSGSRKFIEGCILAVLVFIGGAVVGHIIRNPVTKPVQPTCYEVQLLTQATDGTQAGAAAVICYKPLEQQQGVQYIGTEANPSILGSNRGVR